MARVGGPNVALFLFGSPANGERQLRTEDWQRAVKGGQLPLANSHCVWGRPAAEGRQSIMPL